MEKRIWRQKYTSIPPLPCPKCNGKVRLDASSLVVREPKYSEQRKGEEGWSFNDIEQRFVCFLVCNTMWCGEVVAVSGYVAEVEEPNYTEDDVEIDVVNYYYPKSMVPGPKVIPISKKLSGECQADLLNALMLLWSDHSACANRLRIFVEHLLDQLGVSRKIPKTRSTLDDRIKKFGEDNPEHEGILHALREVGNVGSHTGKTKFDDVVKCFSLVEAIINALIVRPMDEIHETAKQLRASYGPKPLTKPGQN
jgi:Domain of unknown function (DUF4145)